MKTEIKINHENLSRYSQRTQKVVKEVLGQDVKLNEDWCLKKPFIHWFNEKVEIVVISSRAHSMSQKI